jgi:hypothetical protein
MPHSDRHTRPHPFDQNDLWHHLGSQQDYNADRVWGYCGVARV